MKTEYFQLMMNSNDEFDETINEKRKLPKKKIQRNDRILENKLLQARKNENVLIPIPRKRIRIIPKIPIESQTVVSPHLFFQSLHVSTKTKKVEAPKVKRKPKYLLKQVERIQLPQTPKETVFLRKQKVKKEEKFSAFFQPAIDRNSYHQHRYNFPTRSDLRRAVKQREKKLNEYDTVRKKAFDEIKTIDSDIQHVIDGIRRDIKKSSNEIMKEMELQRHTTRKQIAELRKMFSYNNKTALNLL